VARWCGNTHRDLGIYQIPKGRATFETVGLLGIVSALSVADTIKAVIARPGLVQVKWPNDVLINGRKVCGVLIEIREIEANLIASIGIGVNVSRAPILLSREEYTLPPTSIFDNYYDDSVRETQIELVIEKLSQCLHARLESLIQDRSLGSQLDDWLSMDSLLNKRVKLFTPQNDNPIIVVCRGINDKGQMIGELGRGVRKQFLTGDVIQIRGDEDGTSDDDQSRREWIPATPLSDGEYEIRSPLPGILQNIFV
jgi:BirA family biotin operon repressor/biotin-[acetyl-CoA-carboxylase] ligase